MAELISVEALTVQELPDADALTDADLLPVGQGANALRKTTIGAARAALLGGASNAATATALANEAAAAATTAAAAASTAAGQLDASLAQVGGATLAANNAADFATTAGNAAGANATAAEQATDAAISAAGTANTAASNANTKANLADAKATLANNAAANADTKAALADTKATLADTKAGLASAAATSANDATAAANSAVAALGTAKDDAIAATANANSKATLANNAATAALSAAATVQANEFTFTATAGQAAFTLPVTPGVNVFVYKNGARLKPSDFTRSGAVVTLGAACTAGDFISIVVGEAALQATVDHTNVAGLAADLTAAKARANHTGTQAISTVTGLQTALDGKAASADLASPAPGKGVDLLGYSDTQTAPEGTAGSMIRRQRDADALNLLDYCTSQSQRTAVLGGNTGLDVPMQDAMDDALAQGRPILLPGYGTFETSDGAKIRNGGVKLLGEGATVKRNGSGALFVTDATDPVLSGGLLASDATFGQLSVTLQSGSAAAFTVNQWVVIMDRTRIHAENNYRAEFAKIQAIVGNVVSFWGPLKYSYATSTSARLIAAPFVRGIGYHGFKVLMDPTVAPYEWDGTGYEHFDCAFDLNWALRPQLSVEVHDFLHSAIHLRNCLGARVGKAWFDNGGSATSGTGDPDSSEGLPGFSYAVSERGLNEGLIADGLTVTACRHGYTTQNNYSGDGSIPDYGEPVGSLIANSTHLFAKNMAWDTHQAGRGITFANLVAVKGRYGACQIRSRQTVARGLTADTMIGPALWIRGGDASMLWASGTDADLIRAIRTNLGTTFDGIDWRERGAVCDEAHRTRGGRIYAEEVGGPVLQLGRNAAFISQHWDRVEALNVAQLAATNKNVVLVDNIGASDNMEIRLVTVREDNSKVADIVKVAAASGTLALGEVSGGGYTGASIVTPGAATVRPLNGTMRTYTVAGLPTGVSNGTVAFANNGRAFNGAGVLEASGAGTGVSVTRVGSAWKITGTNVTVSA